MGKGTRKKRGDSRSEMTAGEESGFFFFFFQNTIMINCSKQTSSPPPASLLSRPASRTNQTPPKNIQLKKNPPFSTFPHSPRKKNSPKDPGFRRRGRRARESFAAPEVHLMPVLAFVSAHPVIEVGKVEIVQTRIVQGDGGSFAVGVAIFR